MKHKYDFLVIGSGLAGLAYALKVAEQGTVCLLTKNKLEDSNTAYAQGGIAAVTYKPDNFEKHVEDTLTAGAGICNEEVVRMIVTEAPKQVKELIAWGTHFDKDENGNFDLAKEGGHSEHRILHHKDNTGFEIQRALTDSARHHKNIDVFENHFALDLITQHHLGRPILRGTPGVRCFGAYALNTTKNCIETVLAKCTFIATGGNGNIYQTTTNPVIATGDGIAMVYRAKGYVENTEFVQFHPTSLYNPGERPSFLITEALRGFGGILKNSVGDEFMFKYDKRESLAPRDIVARAIDTELKNRGDDFVLLDCTHLDPDKLTEKFPNIFKKCMDLGIDIRKQAIPVVPAAHYICGGIKVNANGMSSIENLYAGGEVTSTGMHGANRLASNSLIEAIVYADRAAKDSSKNMKSIKHQENIPDWNDEGTSMPEEMVLITQSMKELQQIMSNYVGIVRSNVRLKRALDRLEILYRETEELYDKSVLSVRLCELRNAINVSYLIIKQAMNRKESRGLHYNLDYPNKYPV